MHQKVSVIVNCHNGEQYLRECISSILNQKYRNLELIFFDNFSSDNSKKIITNINDNRIKYFFSNKKLSLYAARNEAVKVSSGEIIAFLDVDDWWDENYLSSRANVFDDESYDYYYSNVSIFYEKYKKYKKYKKFFSNSRKIYNLLAKDYFIIISGLMIRKEVFNKAGYFNSNLNIIGDFDFMMRISKKFNAHSINDTLIFYRYHENNYSKLNSEMFFNEYNEWYKNQIKSKDQNFLDNIIYFENKLLSLEIKNLLINKNKNFYLFKKILRYPEFLKKIKYLILFLLPKIFINYSRK